MIIEGLDKQTQLFNISFIIVILNLKIQGVFLSKIRLCYVIQITKISVNRKHFY